MSHRAIQTIGTGLTILFAILWLHQCSKPVPKPDDTAYMERISALEKQVQSKDSLISDIQAIRDTQTKAYRSDSSRLSIENRRLSVANSALKRRVLELPDTFGIISAYVASTDSLLGVKDSVIAVERNTRLASDKLYQVEIAALAQKNVLQIEISQEYATRIAQLTDKNLRLEKRLERKRKFQGVLLGIAGGLGAALAITIATK